MIGQNFRPGDGFQGVQVILQIPKAFRVIGDPRHQHMPDPHFLALVGQVLSQRQNVFIAVTGELSMLFAVHFLDVQDLHQVGLPLFRFVTQGIGVDGLGVGDAVQSPVVGDLSHGVQGGQQAVFLRTVGGGSAGGKGGIGLSAVGGSAGSLTVDHVGGDGQDRGAGLGIPVGVTAADLVEEGPQQPGGNLVRQPVHPPVKFLNDLIVIGVFRGDPLHCGAALDPVLLIEAAVEGVQEGLGQVCPGTEELDLLAGLGGGNAAANGVVIAPLRLHHVVIFVLDGAGVDGDLGGIALESIGKPMAVEHRQVRPRGIFSRTKLMMAKARKISVMVLGLIKGALLIFFVFAAGNRPVTVCFLVLP